MSVVEREQVVEPLVEVRVWTKGDVLRRAAAITCTKGVYRGSGGCVLERLAEAHKEITGEEIFWTGAGELYFGPMMEVVYTVNDARGFGANRRRKDWATNLLLTSAESEDARSG